MIRICRCNKTGPVRSMGVALNSKGLCQTLLNRFSVTLYIWPNIIDWLLAERAHQVGRRFPHVFKCPSGWEVMMSLKLSREVENGYRNEVFG